MISTNKWAVPVLCVLAAGGYAAAFAAHGDIPAAIIGAAIMLVYGGVLVALSRRSEVAALLRGDTQDERRTLINLRASAMAAYAIIVVSLIMVFVELARGRDPGVWGTVAAVGGAGYIAGIVLFSRRG